MNVLIENLFGKHVLNNFYVLIGYSDIFFCDVS